MIQAVELQVVTSAPAQCRFKPSYRLEPRIKGPEVDQRRLSHPSQLVMPVVSPIGAPEFKIADRQPWLTFQPSYVSIGRMSEKLCSASDQRNSAIG